METTDTIKLPYKIQIYIPEHLRDTLKLMAHDERTSLQNLVAGLLAVSTKDAIAAVRPALRKHLARLS